MGGYDRSEIHCSERNSKSDIPKPKYDFWTREKMEGGREITRKIDLETIPLYVRAGAVLPMGPVRQYTSEQVKGPLTILIHPGSDGAFSLYEDDGNTFNHRRGEYVRLNFAWNDRQRRLTLRPGNGPKMMGAAKRNMVFQIAGESHARELEFSGRPMEIRL